MAVGEAARYDKGDEVKIWRYLEAFVFAQNNTRVWVCCYKTNEQRF